jgi:hypothetical protein
VPGNPVLIENCRSELLIPDPSQATGAIDAARKMLVPTTKSAKL